MKSALSTFRENSNGANGLIFDSSWRLLACEASRDKPRVTRTGLKTGRVEVLAELYEGKPLTSPNDLTIDGQDVTPCENEDCRNAKVEPKDLWESTKMLSLG